MYPHHMFDLEPVGVIRHNFHSYFWSIFDPTSSLSFTDTLFLLLRLSFLCFIPLTTTRQGHSLIGIGTGLPIPDIGCQTATQSLGYRVPETVHLPFNHPILHWNLLHDLLHFPLFKVQDFLNMEHK